MYNNFKKIIHTFLPKKTLFKIEPNLRFLWALFYRGSKHECAVCKTNLRAWIDFHKDTICPNCGSLSRDRRLWQLIEKKYLKEAITVLDFSPSRSLYRKWKKQNVLYKATDLSGDFISDNQYDITSIPEAENTFDLIICYHVLEHVIEDLLAMKELHRTLKPTGTLVVQTPFKEGEIYEDYSIISEKDRLLHFGQEDHVRIYSVEGLKTRLTQSGFEVEVHQFSEDDLIHGLTQNEIVLILKKRF
ncbi:class I SAM-dependent methyltransferase [Flavobacterium alvei]|uniref:class I SAM-dependent methyltransferase n=1 Tax=Flavobacterium alvei TaxID=2080416 RepID=UPI0026EFB206|nr:class I SAM-dependent methyltransferase [Flavobacterium alvei]